MVVVGGGMAGMTAAKYLRLWGGVGLQVTLVEPDALYTSNIMSNLVLNGSRTVASLQFRRDALTTRYGVVRKSGRVVAIDPLSRNVTPPVRLGDPIAPGTASIARNMPGQFLSPRTSVRTL